MEYHAYLLTLYEKEYFWFDSNRHEINESPFIDHGAMNIFITECYKKKKVPKESFFKKWTLRVFILEKTKQPNIKYMKFLSEMAPANCVPLTFFAMILSQANDPSIINQIRNFVKIIRILVFSNLFFDDKRCQTKPYQNLMRKWMSYSLAMAFNEIKNDLNMLKISLIKEKK